MAGTNEKHKISKASWIWTTLQALLLFLALGLGFNVLLNVVVPPEGMLRMSYTTGGPDCADFARHLEANNPHGVHFTVTPMGEPSTGPMSLCWLDLGGKVTSWDVGDENRPLVVAAQTFMPTSGSFNQELIITPALGRWRAPLILIPATLLTALWFWRRRRSDLRASRSD